MSVKKQYASTEIHSQVFVLFSADADRDGALDRFKTKIVLSSNGRNMWLGPVLYTFSCKINVNFFPFDEQVSVLENLYMVTRESVRATF